MNLQKLQDFCLKHKFSILWCSMSSIGALAFVYLSLGAAAFGLGKKDNLNLTATAEKSTIRIIDAESLSNESSSQLIDGERWLQITVNEQANTLLNLSNVGIYDFTSVSFLILPSNDVKLVHVKLPVYVKQPDNTFEKPVRIKHSIQLTKSDTFVLGSTLGAGLGVGCSFYGQTKELHKKNQVLADLETRYQRQLERNQELIRAVEDLEDDNNNLHAALTQLLTTPNNDTQRVSDDGRRSVVNTINVVQEPIIRPNQSSQTSIGSWGTDFGGTVPLPPMPAEAFITNIQARTSLSSVSEERPATSRQTRLESAPARLETPSQTDSTGAGPHGND